MTIERYRQISILGRDVRVPFTKRTVKAGTQLDFVQSVPVSLSLDGSPTHAGFQVASSHLTAHSTSELGVDYRITFEPDVALLDAMDNLTAETMKPRLIREQIGTLTGSEINGTIPPSNRVFRTVFRYRADKK